MIATRVSLNGAWQMQYSETAYTSKECPQEGGSWIENAVPGYWEDMTEAFRATPFGSQLRINPEFGGQRYPMTGDPPDMALPNIIGNFTYRRTFFWEGGDAVLQFEGAQNALSAWINGNYLGRHEGYSTPFSFAVPADHFLPGSNTIVLSVSNYGLTGYGGEPVSGLTNRAACLYTGGITGDVTLLQYISPLRDVSVRISEDLCTVEAEVEMAAEATLQWQVLDGSHILITGEANGDFVFSTEGLAHWSPENPKCYTLRLICGQAVLDRTFGVRRLTAKGNRLFLNQIPVYLRGVCEHCYYPETVHPTNDIGFYRNVIRKLKSLGFNFIRFHTYIPPEAYMQAADELGMLMQVESPNNTTLQQWHEILRFCRCHPAVVIYCCGNELLMDDPFIEHLRRCAQAVHTQTDGLFAPMSALRGLDYYFEAEPDIPIEPLPLPHNPRRIRTVSGFSDLLNTGGHSHLSYFSTRQTPASIDRWNTIYSKPLLIHELCIDGTYTDLSLKDRYVGTRIGNTEMFSSIEAHLQDKGILDRAPLYFRNSCQWQQRLRKYCFEKARLCHCTAGFDFLGPIDTHWHTFGYDVGMMNEFYELKPGETTENVLMYNSPTVLLNDLGTDRNFFAGDILQVQLLTSHYNAAPMENAVLKLQLTLEDSVLFQEEVTLVHVPNGCISPLHQLCVQLPHRNTPGKMELSAVLECGTLRVENRWELYLFPQTVAPDSKDLIISQGMDLQTLRGLMEQGKDVLLLGTEPFQSLRASFRMSLAGRTGGNLATTIADHPCLDGLPHEGFCGWQFRRLLENAYGVCFTDDVPFDPIVELVSTHKCAVKQAALFEYRVGRGRLLVCGLSFAQPDPNSREDVPPCEDTYIDSDPTFKRPDPAAVWLKNRLIAYASGDHFSPKYTLAPEQLTALANGTFLKAELNTNLAFNLNDITAVRGAKGDSEA